MKSPAFRFYPADFMGSPDVQAMDLEEVGAYLFLLCMAWQSERHGYLEDSEDRLRRLAHMNHEQWARSRGLLLRKFPVVETGWRANGRMVREAEKQQHFSESQSAKGKLGGRPKKAGEKPELSNEKPELSTGLSPEKPSVSVSVFNTKDKEAVEEVFAYYLEQTGRKVGSYTLTPARTQKGLARLRECLSRSGGEYAPAIGLMKTAVDGICKSDWHMGRDPKAKGKRYVEWEKNLFKSLEDLEKWIERGATKSEGSNARFVDPAAVYMGKEYSTEAA